MKLKYLRFTQGMDAAIDAGTQLAKRFADFQIREMPVTLTHCFDADSVSEHDRTVALYVTVEVKRAFCKVYPGANPEVTATISRDDTSVTATVTLVHI